MAFIRHRDDMGFASRVAVVLRNFNLLSACEAGVSVKPGAQAPGTFRHDSEPVTTGESPLVRQPFARSRGLPFRFQVPGAHAPGFMLTPAFAG
jgi:hypothetical protein